MHSLGVLLRTSLPKSVPTFLLAGCKLLSEHEVCLPSLLVFISPLNSQQEMSVHRTSNAKSVWFSPLFKFKMLGSYKEKNWFFTSEIPVEVIQPDDGAELWFTSQRGLKTR